MLLVQELHPLAGSVMARRPSLARALPARTRAARSPAARPGPAG